MSSTSPGRRGARSAAGGVCAAILFPAAIGLAADSPQPAAFRAAFEAAYPKTGASGSALALEEIGASLGLDLVPAGVDPAPPPPDPAPPAGETVLANATPPRPRRSHPDPAVAREFRAIAAMAREYTDREAKSSQERLGAPPPGLEDFLSQNDATLSAIRSILLAKESVAWEMDGSKRNDSPFPNLNGIGQLQRILFSRALVECRAQRFDDALETLEACWRLNDALRMRPEVISQLILLAIAKPLVGVLRKIEVPAYGWPDRLRDGSVMQAFLAALENQVWFRDSPASDLTGKDGGYGRLLQRVGEEFRSGDLCRWTGGSLEELVDGVLREERQLDDEQPLVDANLPDLLLRIRRYEIDAELTALVIDARLERDASRRRRWPAKLLSAGTGVCPEQKWTYRAFENGTARVAMESRVAESESPALRLPLEFFAGKPVPAPKRPAASKPSDAPPPEKARPDRGAIPASASSSPR